MRREQTKEGERQTYSFPVGIHQSRLTPNMSGDCYIYWNRVNVVGFERNLDVSRETLINKFGNGNCYWVTLTSVIGPIGLVRILIFPQKPLVAHLHWPATIES